MLLKILLVWRLYSYFAIVNAIGNFSLLLNYSIIYPLIFQTKLSTTSKWDLSKSCEVILYVDSLEFKCNQWDDRENYQWLIPDFKGFFKLDKEAEAMFYCVQDLQKAYPKIHCEKSEEFYLKGIFKKFKTKDVHEINIIGNQYINSENINFISMNFPNVKKIIWRQINKCQSLNQYLRNFKKLNEFEIHLENAITFEPGCYFTNLTQIKELRIEIIQQNKSYYSEKYFFTNEIFLRGMEKLEVFELKFDPWFIFVEIPKKLFQGLSNLSSIAFTNCYVMLTEDHFQYLFNLKYLSFKKAISYYDDWIGSSIIQNKLMILESSYFPGDPNLTAFICADPNICEFNVDINKKHCPKECFLNRRELRFVIDCHQVGIGMAVPELPIPINGNASLYFNSKNLTQLPNSTLYGYSNIRELHLANNHISNITLEQLPTNLTYLDLRNNSLQTLDNKVLEFLSARADRICMNLSGNPWICNCNTLDLLHFLANLSNNIEDREYLKCNEMGFSMFLLTDVCKSYFYNILVLLMGFAVMVFIYFYTKKSILMWLFERNLCLNWISRPEPKVDNSLKIDAFLAFSHVDLELVEEYVEQLERGPRQYQLCFYQRDWLIGESIPSCILNSIEDSKRIIVLMTNNFINSSWGLFEFRSATSINKDKRLIVILYPEVDITKLDAELKIYMKYHTYLRRDDPQFWRKLMFAMPHKPIHCEQAALAEVRAIELEQL